jgi:protein-tyrosine sulfotransferase
MIAPTNRFFIVGCQRSGTTLLRLILESHPAIACLDEDRSYAALASGSVEVPAGKRLIGLKIPRWTETLLDTITWDAMQTETARNCYQGEPILFMLRDVRDTVASMLKLKFGGLVTWLEACARPILQQKMGHGQTAWAKQFARDLQLVRDNGEPPHLVGALYWKYKTQTYFRLRDLGLPVCPVRYELLTRYPRQHIARVLDFLGVGWDNAVLEHAQHPHSEVYANGLVIGDTDPNRPIDSHNIGHYVHFLTAEQSREVMTLAGALNRRVRVECSGGGAWEGLARRVWVRVAP